MNSLGFTTEINLWSTEYIHVPLLGNVKHGGQRTILYRIQYRTVWDCKK